MGDPKPASMEDLTEVKSSVAEVKTSVSTLEAQMSKMLVMLEKLGETKTAPKPIEDPETPEDLGGESDEAKRERLKSGSSTASKELGDKEKDYHNVNWISPDPPIPHPPINNRGNPPKLDSINFNTWQAQMRSHICSSSNELWRVIENGFQARDPSNPTRREVVDGQLNSTSLHMIQQAVGEKDWPYVGHFTVAKDAWKGLEEVFLGNESMRRTRFEAFRNSTEGFYKKDDENHEEMY